MEAGFEGGSFPFATQSGLPEIDDIQQLRNEVVNEKLAPNILPHKQELVQRVRSQLESQEEVIEELSADTRNAPSKLAGNLLQQERVRVQWLLKEYLRARLRKLERYAVALIKDIKEEEEQGVESGLLSEAERVYLEAYFVTLGRHFRGMVLSHLPEDYQSLVKSHKDEEAEDMVDRPPLQSYVFCKALQDIGLVRIDDSGNEAHLSTGDLYVMRYDFVADLLQQGLVALV